MKNFSLKQILVISGLALAALLFIPFIPISVLPEMRLIVVDKQNIPRPGRTVRQRWQHYSYESDTHTETAVSDADGFVNFPSQRIWISFFSFAVGTTGDLIPFNPHGSSGPRAFFLVDKTDSNSITYRGNGELPAKIVVDK